MVLNHLFFLRKKLVVRVWNHFERIFWPKQNKPLTPNIDWGVALSRLIKSTRSSTQISCLQSLETKRKGSENNFKKKWANHPSNQNNNESLIPFPKVLRIQPYIKKSCPWSMTNNGIYAKATCFRNVEPKISFYAGSTCPRLRGNGPWQKTKSFCSAGEFCLFVCYEGLKAMTPREMMVMPVHSPARFQGYLASLRALPEKHRKKIDFWLVDPEKMDRKSEFACMIYIS